MNAFSSPRIAGLPLALVVLPLLLAGCALLGPREESPREPGVGPTVSWSEVPGWERGVQSGAWPALLRTCQRLGSTPEWRAICNEAEVHPEPSHAQARFFMRTRFLPRRMVNGEEDNRGLITGYYVPLLEGSREPTDRYKYPLYRPPDDLLRISLESRFRSLSGKRVRGRITRDRKVVPYYDRAQIEGPAEPLAGNELLWVDSRVDRFFLHIQGSGRVRLPDGEVVKVGYADQNGHPYTSIGRILIERGEIPREEVSLPTIRQWLRENPGEVRSLLNENPSYVFFQIRDNDLDGPLGSLGIPLTPRRSLAVDPDHIPLGYPVWMTTKLPEADHGGGQRPFRRLTFAQDTGGAIRGPVRADLFTGQGVPGEWLAGRMKDGGRLFVLQPAWTYEPSGTRLAGEPNGPES
ncbi:murein transglycosylase A [Thiohalorhabdus denitrificans]|uniref:Membrane-bound lytic murein transglycosylase A n=1 Tax=Thiohalorhabdus denitrificans TaxID=381306 RepID=A0A1G5AIB9_9GAMM|nr:murein transglycosylase A [Thiohalorhabdus denitrificans]SCX77634.1 membrane-bound lytic murein transglycosylase A [Thiohalorhabdus denitrificans]